ncbi:MAG: hypothetical protein FJ218_00920 [Ignavibacteria bacterium]|nr:hypothetical protein [Ignavibacteria bacterium]
MKKNIIVLCLLLFASQAFGKIIVFGVDLSSSFQPMQDRYIEKIMNVIRSTDGKDTFYIYKLDPILSPDYLYSLFPPPCRKDTCPPDMTIAKCLQLQYKIAKECDEELASFLTTIGNERDSIRKSLGGRNGSEISRIFEGIKVIVDRVPLADKYYFLTDGLEVNGSFKEGGFDFEHSCEGGEINRFYTYMQNNKNDFIPKNLALLASKSIIIYGIGLPIISPSTLPCLRSSSRPQIEASKVTDRIKKLFEDYFKLINVTNYEIGGP